MFHTTLYILFIYEVLSIYKFVQMTYQESFRSSDKGNYGHSWTNDRNSFPLFEEITKTPRNKIHQTSESQCNFWQMKFKRSLWKCEFKSLTNLWCLLKSILRVLKTRKASLQHKLVCNKTMTDFDEVILIVAIDTVNSLLSTHSNGSLVYLIDSNQVNRAGQANNCKCPLNTHWCPLCKSNFCPLQYP